MRKASHSKLILAGVVASLIAAPAALAQTAIATPKLAPNVKPQAGYEAATERLVVANPTPIYSDIMETSPTTGDVLPLGQPVTARAKVKDWDWILVGRDGVGVGYVPRDLLKPAPGGKRAA